jgi:hypothetical protein
MIDLDIIIFNAYRRTAAMKLLTARIRDPDYREEWCYPYAGECIVDRCFAEINASLTRWRLISLIKDLNL